METHTGWALIGRDPPYGAKHWYLASELAYVTGARKMTATASVIGPVWEEIGKGASAWGDAGRFNGSGPRWPLLSLCGSGPRAGHQGTDVELGHHRARAHQRGNAAANH